MIDWLAAQARANPKGLALIFQEQTWNYAKLDQQTDILCSQLAGLHIPQGARIAVHLPNSAQYVALVHALARLGLILAPLNIRLSIPELAAQIDQINCNWLIGGPTSDLAGLKKEGRTILTLSELQERPRHSFQSVPFDLQRLQGIIFTSGTSGIPKGVMLTFANHFWSAFGSAVRLGMLPGDRWLSPLPLYHVGGQAALFRCCLYGASLLLHAAFNLDEIKHSLQHESPTLASLVPTMLHRLLLQGEWQAPHLRLLLLGGAAASTELIQAARSLAIPLAVTYGLTEASSQVATLPAPDSYLKPGSAGKGLLFTHIRLADEIGQDLPPGELGEILVAGPTVMSGYDANPTATQKAIQNGWLHTGDIGYLDEEGDLWLVQRRSDLILSGGENIYPAEVERALRSHPDIAEACVVGVADPEWGQRVAALVVLQPGKTLTIDELLAHSRTHLAGYKQPRQVEFVAELPQTASGKIDRREVLRHLSKSAG